MPVVSKVALGVLLLLLAVVAADQARAQGLPADAPNVLVIVTDDQRASDTLLVMPQTRRYFKRGGTRYSNAFATTPLCCPSRASILTGRYAHNTRVRKNPHATRLDVSTMFVRLLQEAGYRTALVGKFLNGWPAGTPPPFFDRYARYLPRSGQYWNPIFDINGAVRKLAGYETDIIRTYALRYLRRFERSDDAPWLLFVAPNAPHHPWTPELPYADARLEPWPGNPSVFEANRSDKPAYVRASRYSLADARRVRDGQLRTLMSVDDLVGRVFKELKGLGEGRDTLAFFLSDNGFTWGDHGLGGPRGEAGQKRTPYTASVKIPYLVRWPGRVPAGRTDHRLTGTIDIAPTVLEAAGLSPDPAKPPLDGGSLLKPGGRNRILLEFWGGGSVPSWASVRTRRLQYVEYYDKAGATTFREYYDLIRDPWQLRNMLHAAIPPDDPAIAELSAQLGRDRRCVGTDCP
jgi:arylsulfatase A-like enzyme